MPRIRDFGVTPGYLQPGPLNAITDVPGVRVGHTTVNRDIDGIPWRTGVTAIWPHEGNPLLENVYAATFPLNGLGEMTARSLVEEWGLLGFPIMLTGTNHVGIVYHWTLQYLFKHGAKEAGMTSLIAMVAECDDSYLDGSQGLAVSRGDVYSALDRASSGPVIEGSVGGGTGMQLFDFKGGIGTSSRLVQVARSPYTVGALVMTNFGIQRELHIDGIPVGHLLGEDAGARLSAHRGSGGGNPFNPLAPEGPDGEGVGARLIAPKKLGSDTNRSANEGSCIVVLATDAPLSSRQCERLAKRAALGLARTGSTARDGSGEIIVAFSTGNRIASNAGPEITIRTLVEGNSDAGTSPLNILFTAAIEATEEAIYNALVAAETTTGVGDHVLHAIPHDRLRKILHGTDPN